MSEAPAVAVLSLVCVEFEFFFLHAELTESSPDGLLLQWWYASARVACCANDSRGRGARRRHDATNDANECGISCVDEHCNFLEVGVHGTRRERYALSATFLPAPATEPLLFRCTTAVDALAGDGFVTAFLLAVGAVYFLCMPPALAPEVGLPFPGVPFVIDCGARDRASSASGKVAERGGSCGKIRDSSCGGQPPFVAISPAPG